MHARQLRLSRLSQRAALILALATIAPRALADVPPCPTDTGNAAEMERKARRLFDEALRREPADPRGALEILTCIQRFADKPAVSLRVGTIAERLGNKRLAADSFERYLALAGDAAPDRAEMREHIAQLRGDSEDAPPPPTVPDQPPIEEDRPPPPVEPGQKSATLGWVVTAGGGVLMVVGGALLLSAKGRNDDVHSIEPGTTYWNSDEAKEQLDTAKQEQTFGFIALAAGALTTGVGIWLVLDARSGIDATGRVGRGHASGTVRFRF